MVRIIVKRIDRNLPAERTSSNSKTEAREYTALASETNQRDQLKPEDDVESYLELSGHRTD
jgi:hypothetical protein